MSRHKGQSYKKELKVNICISIDSFLLEYLDRQEAKNRSVAICDIIKRNMEVKN